LKERCGGYRGERGLGRRRGITRVEDRVGVCVIGACVIGVCVIALRSFPIPFTSAQLTRSMGMMRRQGKLGYPSVDLRCRIKTNTFVFAKDDAREDSYKIILVLVDVKRTRYGTTRMVVCMDAELPIVVTEG